MGRPREFDEAKALDRAMEVFWKQGYENTSLNDLLEAMHIQRGSFYNTFGSKKETYLRALDRYGQFMTEGGPYTELANQEPSFKALQVLIDRYLESVAGSGVLKGCFFTHASKENRGNDPEIQKAVMTGLGRMQGLIVACVEAGQRDGQLPEHIDARGAALAFMGLAWGLHVMAEAGVPLADLKHAARQLFGMGRVPA